MDETSEPKRHDAEHEHERRAPTILQVVPELNAGGVERGALEIAQAVLAAGGRALIASAGGRLETRLERLGGEARRLPLATKNPLTIALNARRLARICRTDGVDLVHARSRAPAWSAKWAARTLGLPFVTTYHGAYTESLPLKRRYNAVMASGDAVIAISDFVATLVRERHGVGAPRLVTIPRGADRAIFSESAVGATRVMALASAWGLADDPRPVLMLPGRLTRWKGQTLFLDALARLKAARGPQAFLGLIVGGDAKGDFENELARRIAGLGLADCSRMVGHCDDMPAAFRLAQFVVSASLEPEAFGRVAVEAQAMGLPVIASAHGGAAETVADGVTGFLFEPGSAEALAAALGAALDLPPARRREMGRAAAAHVAAGFTVARMQAATLDVYERVLGRRFPKRPPQ